MRVADRERDWFGVEGEAADAARLARYYDLANDAMAADVEWCRALASRMRGSVLEIACGSGRVAVPLAADGRRVVGLDASPAMLARARERASRAGVDVRFVAADMRDFALDETFALVLLVFNTFLMLDPGDRLACLARVREHLAPAGRFAMHVFQPDPEKIAGAQGGVVETGTYDDPETGDRVTAFNISRASVDRVHFTMRYDAVGADGIVRRIERTATLNYLYRRELELLFAAAGFAIESLQGDFDGSPAGEDSPRLLVVARRRERGEGIDRRHG